MSKNVKAKVQDLSFDMEKKNNQLIIPIGKLALRFERFFPELVKKYENSSDSEFGDLCVGGSFSIEMNCVVVEDSEFMIKEVDGRTGMETWIDSVNDEELIELKMTIYEDSTEVFSRMIPIKELSKDEDQILCGVVSDMISEGSRDVVIS